MKKITKIIQNIKYFDYADLIKFLLILAIIFLLIFVLCNCATRPLTQKEMDEFRRQYEKEQRDKKIPRPYIPRGEDIK